VLILDSSIIELQNRCIEIDGCNICNISLQAVPSSLALVLQDTILFLSTLQENLWGFLLIFHRRCIEIDHRDPLNTQTDAEMISVLQHVWLLPRDQPSDPATEAKFSLDCAISDEGMFFYVTIMILSLSHPVGSNYSTREKQLLALCGALVKNSCIIVLVSFPLWDRCRSWHLKCDQ